MESHRLGVVEEVVVDPNVLHLFALLGVRCFRPFNVLPGHRCLGPVVPVAVRASHLIIRFELELPAVSAGAAEAPDLHTRTPE
jgi:hypothetical protein